MTRSPGSRRRQPARPIERDVRFGRMACWTFRPGGIRRVVVTIGDTSEYILLLHLTLSLPVDSQCSWLVRCSLFGVLKKNYGN